MSTGPSTLPESGGPGQLSRRRGLPRLRDARIRTKLALILVVPIAAVIALATVRLVTVAAGAEDATRIRSMTAISIDVSRLAEDLHAERMAAVTFLADQRSSPDEYRRLFRATDERITTYRTGREGLDEPPAAVRDLLAEIDKRLDTLPDVRRQALGRQQSAAGDATERYADVLGELSRYGDALAQAAPEESGAESRRAVAAYGRARAAVAEQEAVAFSALSRGRLTEADYFAFVSTLAQRNDAQLTFSEAADQAQRDIVSRTVTGDPVRRADQVAADISRSIGKRPVAQAADAATAIGAVDALMRKAEVELQDRLLADAESARVDATRQAAVESVLVLVSLLVAITLAVVLARSLNFSLRRLREGALAVANHDLPEAVSRLQSMGSVGEGEVEEIVREVRDPIQITNRDEVGQVALAFNVVHREAVRVAAEQAALRTSVSTMFLNLARRSQTLVDRMIGELDAIERAEEDPKRLAQLFELDHLATRMRRNDENLLVLAGADTGSPRRDDALLVDVLRAAQSEVEQYNRIEFGSIDTDISIVANAVNDVVRLVAELLDNATRFSPPNTTVLADARRIRDYVLIQVEDRGLGLSDEQLDSLNRRLAAPPTVDVSAFRLMGLAVVSRLAGRYGIRVELRRNADGGTVAQVTLPNATVVLPADPGPEPLPTRNRPSLAAEPGPYASAGLGEAPVAGRTATLSDAWRTSVPAPAVWQGPADARELASDVRVGGTGPVSAAPFSAQPVSAQPMSGAPVSAQPMSAAPFSAQPMSGAPVSAQPMSAAPFSGPPMSGAPVSAAPFSAPSMSAAPVSAQPAAPDSGASLFTPSAGASGALPRRGAAEPLLSGGPTAGPAPVAATSPPPVPLPPVAPPPFPVAPPAPPAVAASAAPLIARPDRPADSPIFREMEAVWFRSHGNDATAIFTRPRFDEEPPALPQREPVPAPPVAAAPPVVPAPPVAAAPPVAPAPPPPPYVPPAAAPPAAVPVAPAEPSTPAPSPVGPAASVSEGLSVSAPPAYSAPEPAVNAEEPVAASASEPLVEPDAWRTAADDGWTRASKAAAPAAAGTTRSGLPKRVPQAQLVPGGIEEKGGRDRTRRTPDEVRGLLSAYHRGVQRGRTAGAELNSTPTKETTR
ncbi:sensor histidine kinase [Micromonospora siamensis]|uniref:histidine kinase n=1 Tax=Micromonospora siamensis TaxID=299152 RepID=A0A1C5K5T3_9ACTN|nr:nitrate- and nitrite sensing domain-containing protein [Micromonospora siamensis]SCG78128.1 Signal transduction histidine kinase [Micromonospora siamensis]